MKRNAMNSLLATLAALLLSAPCLAQAEVGSWTLMPKVGLNWATTTDDGIYYDLSGGVAAKANTGSKRGVAAGVEVEWQWLAGVGLSAGLAYSPQGTKYDDAPENFHDVKLEADYLNMPVMAHFYVAPGLAVQLGVQPGFALHQRLSGEEHFSENNVSGYRHFSTDPHLKTFDVGIPLGLSYDLGDVRMELRYAFGLRNVAPVGFKERHRVLQVTLGYRIGL